MENTIEFKKTRDLGTIITDAFKFVRENWKGYFGTIIRISAPAAIVFIVVMALYMRSLGGMMSDFTEENLSSSFPVSGLEAMAYVLLAMLSGLVFYVLMKMTSLYYIKSYIDNKGTVNRSEIIANVKQNFWKFLGYYFLMMIMIMFGAMLCVLPGVWIGVILSLGASILVFEDKNVGDTISYCFTLIKNHWWETFGVLLVVGILIGVLGQIFAVPALIYQFVQMGIGVSNSDPTAVFSLFSDPIYLLLTILSYVGQFLLSSITLITSVFIYYDLNEQKNLTGTIEKIDNLGSSL